MFKISIVVLCCLTLAACGEPNLIDGKSVRDWRDIATELQNDLDEARKDLERARTESVVPAADFAVVDNPCFQFASSKVEREVQEKACVAWIEALDRRAVAERTELFEARETTHKQLWADHPDLMTQYVVLVDKLKIFDNYEDLQKQEAGMQQFLSDHPGFGAKIKSMEYRKGPEQELSERVYGLLDVWKAFSEYLTIRAAEEAD